MMLINLAPSFRQCTKCRKQKTIADFGRHPKGRDGLNSWCRPCHNRYIREWRNTPTGKTLFSATLKRYRKSCDKRDLARRDFAKHVAEYGIDVEDWARMYEAQLGRCLGCTSALLFDRTTHVDHCHATGRVRGLLCGGCNSSLGGAKDDPATLRRLALYLERFL